MYELIIFCCNCGERGKDKKKKPRQPLGSPGLRDGARNKSWAARLAPSNVGVGAAPGRAGMQDPASSCAHPLSWDTRRWNCPHGISCVPKWDLLPRAAAAQGTLYACGFLPPRLPCTRWCFHKSLGFTEPRPCRAAGSRPVSRNPPDPSRSTHRCLFPPFVQPGQQTHRQERLWGAGGVSRRHTLIPQPSCQAAAGSAPAPWSRFVRRRRGR